MAKINLKFLNNLSKKGKILLISILVFVIAGGAVLTYFLTRTPDNQLSQYSQIYKNYQSFSGFSEAEEILHLKDGVRVAKYDIESKIFILKKTVILKPAEDEYDEDETIEYFGFANMEQVLVDPGEHKYLGVLAVKENYAIVAKGEMQDEDLVYKVGLIRFDKNGVYEYGFYHDYRALLTTVSFCGDYIAMFAGKDYINPATASYTVFYDYTSTNELNEVFKVQSEASFLFGMEENWLYAADLNKIYFYDTQKIDANGYVIKQDTYYPFDDEEMYLPSYISFSINYLGNNWFLRKAMYYQYQPYDGYKYIIAGETEDETLYVIQKNDRYNAANKRVHTSDILLVDNVANEYSKDVFNALATGSNLTEISQILGSGASHIIYSDPAFPPSAFVNDGYSIVYNYFFPEPTDVPETSYLIIDKNANIIRQEELYLPPLFVDGIGVENPSVNYPNLIGNAQVHYINGDKSILKQYEEGYYTYESTFVNDNMLVVYQYKIVGMNVQPKAGAINMAREVQSVPFIYDTLSMFAGGYAIGSILDLESNIQYYRVSKDGVQEPISAIYSVKHGAYITLTQGRKALWAYDGTPLIPNYCSDIILYEMFLSEGCLLQSIAVTDQGDGCVVYILK